MWDCYVIAIVYGSDAFSYSIFVRCSSLFASVLCVYLLQTPHVEIGKTKRQQSVSLASMPPGVLADDSPDNSADDIQIALAPHIQAYLSQIEKRHSCCSVFLPVAFERASSNSWLTPKFDSPILEEQYQTSVFPHLRMKYRFTLWYIILCSLVWSIYFALSSSSKMFWAPIIMTFLILAVVALATLMFTRYSRYHEHISIVSVITAVILCTLSLLGVGLTEAALSPLAHFAICVTIVLLIYTAIPMKLWLSAIFAITYSILFEILTYRAGFIAIHGTVSGNNYKIVIMRALLQFCIHLVSMHVLVMSEVRMRGMFMKVGQTLLVRRQLEMEKQLNEKMIHSVMPPKVANKLLNEGGLEDNNVKYMDLRSSDVKSLFRPFLMHSMDNVSILFADIVGFTSMSTSKTAEQLVEILNDLFERFDDLCVANGCEKISTLGDCYYCVSGCPEPRPDHATCCVEMGLGMISAMRVFDAKRHEGIKMRVGIHTGSILCGIVGTRRVKFDVWSNDVSFANKMESTGRPEQVHISEETSKFVSDAYILEEGEMVLGHRTFFVIGCKHEHLSPSTAMSLNLFLKNSLSQSSTNVSENPGVPPASPVGQLSLDTSPKFTVRPRLSSLHTFKKNCSLVDPLSGATAVDSKISRHSNPTIIITTKSLPDSLNSDEGGCNGNSIVIDKPNSNPEEDVRTKNKIPNWRVPRFFRRNEDSKKSESSPNNKPEHLTSSVADECTSNTEQIGNQQIPLLIETVKSTCTLDIPHKPSRSTTALSPKLSEDDCCSPDQLSIYEEVIDIRSYISQSRSDVTPFGRSSSYKSRSGRSGQSGPWDSSSISRGVASNAGVEKLEVTPTLVQGMNLLYSDCNSLCPSATSRKDSGIKSNSRRSSIQQQIYVLNQSAPLSQHRVSGYFTSSGSDLSLPQMVTNQSSAPTQKTVSDPLAECLQKLRKQSDLQLIRCVRDNAKSQRNYLMKPPLRKFTLFFKSKEMEREFRASAHRFDIESEFDGPPTLATPRYNTYIDVVIAFVVYLSIAVSLFLMAPSRDSVNFRIWVSIFVIFTALQLFVFFLFTRELCRHHSTHKNTFVTDDMGNRTSCTDTIFEAMSSWFPWHICLSLLMSMSTILIVTHFLLTDIDLLQVFEYHYGFLIFVCIIHFCNFTQINWLMRNILAILTAACFVGIAVSHFSAYMQRSEVVDTILQPFTNALSEETEWFQDYHVEIYLDLLLVLAMVWFLNREFEIGYRSTYYGNAVAIKDKIMVQNLKNQADLLLNNIIPKHVVEHLKNTAKYSENHKNIAIIFASIVNFNEMYDESYLGGKEYLRVLNELIGDFDELLSQPAYKSVEKIKTIGSTFMAASGLDPHHRGENNHHIHALIEFSLSMQSVIKAFNEDLLEFNLILRIGFNVGDVTAGVIGTSKLYYDIWGDAVNVASRMDSTGLPGRIQVVKDCLQYLEDEYEFESRGNIFVKGKDDMEVFLLKGRKTTGGSPNGN